jgi:hypothetical protein
MDEDIIKHHMENATPTIRTQFHRILKNYLCTNFAFFLWKRWMKLFRVGYEKPIVLVKVIISRKLNKFLL